MGENGKKKKIVARNFAHLRGDEKYAKFQCGYGHFGKTKIQKESNVACGGDVDKQKKKNCLVAP